MGRSLQQGQSETTGSPWPTPRPRGSARQDLQITGGPLGRLIDPDLSKEAARLEALRIRQGLAAAAQPMTERLPRVLGTLFGRLTQAASRIR